MSAVQTVIYPQGCRWDFVCKKSGKYSTVKGSHCLHNGGVDCKEWRKQTDESLKFRSQEIEKVHYYGYT